MHAPFAPAASADNTGSRRTPAPTDGVVRAWARNHHMRVEAVARRAGTIEFLSRGRG